HPTRVRARGKIAAALECRIMKIVERRLSALGATALAALFGFSLAIAGGQEECLGCHADATLTTERQGRTISLQADAAALQRSVHRDIECTDCHAGIDPANVPHRTKIRAVDCAACHGDVAEKHPFHPQMAAA